MTGDPVTHQELNRLLTSQTDTIISKMNRVEDSLKVEIEKTGLDCEKDVKAVDERVTYLERRSRTENILGSAIAFAGAALVAWFGGKQ